MNIRLLTTADWQEWKNLRLEAIQNELTAFLPYYEEESIKPDQYFKDIMANNHLFGAFIDERLVGFIGYYGQALRKQKHKGEVWGTYVSPEFRGRGISNDLLNATISHAQSRVDQLLLTCLTTNQTAKNLYEKHGFKIYGTEERSLCVDDVFYDEYLMALRLN